MKVEVVSGKWYLVDARGKVLGRMAAKIASVLRGKHRPNFAPYMDFGDHVVVVNAGEVFVTGKKENQKNYKRYSGYPGGLKELPLHFVREKEPERIIEHAVKGMLPKNKLGRKLFKHLHVYASSKHPHQAQSPKEMEL